MNKLNFLAILFSLFSLSYSQNFKAKITYEASLDNTDYYNRLIDDTTITEFNRNAKLRDIHSTSPMNFILFINKDEAMYKAEYSLSEQKSLGMGFNRTGNVAQAFNTYYSNLQTHENFYKNFFTPEVLVIMEKADWLLTKETKKIGKYTCYKATAIIDSEQEYGMNFLSPIVAWYTSEIPTSFGIQTFQGLPGLTMELITDYEDGKVTYKAIEIDLNPEDIVIEKPTGVRQISEQEYIKYINNAN